MLWSFSLTTNHHIICALNHSIWESFNREKKSKQIGHSVDKNAFIISLSYDDHQC